MKKVSITVKKEIFYYDVYENVQEFETTGIEAKTRLDTLQVGDYFQTDNGYYLPLVSIRVFGKNSEKLKFTFPRLYTMAYRRKDGTLWQPRIIYDPDHVKRKYIDVSDALTFAQMVLAGHSPARAYYILRKQNEKVNGHRMSKQYFDFLESEILHESFKVLAMAELKTELDTVGADANWFAKQLKEIVEDRKEIKEIRLYALQAVKGLLDESKVSTTTVASAKEQVASIKDNIVKKKAGVIEKQQFNREVKKLGLVKTG